MEKLGKILPGINRPKIKSTAYEWQNRALEIWKYLGEVADKKSEVMRLVRTDRTKSEAVISYMQSRRIKSVYYFFKVMAPKRKKAVDKSQSWYKKLPPN